MGETYVCLGSAGPVFDISKSKMLRRATGVHVVIFHPRQHQTSAFPEEEEKKKILSRDMDWCRNRRRAF